MQGNDLDTLTIPISIQCEYGETDSNIRDDDHSHYSSLRTPSSTAGTASKILVNTERGSIG